MALNLIVIKLFALVDSGKIFHEYIYLTTTFTGLDTFTSDSGLNAPFSKDTFDRLLPGKTQFLMQGTKDVLLLAVTVFTRVITAVAAGESQAIQQLPASITRFHFQNQPLHRQKQF